VTGELPIDTTTILSSELLEELAVRICGLSRLGNNVAFEQAIFASLNFHSRPVRHSNIPEAYTNTFSWVFRSEFAEWLQKSAGLFWISGKAGSGKSTLMKFLADHETTHDLLSCWAPGGAVVAAHYFWSAGTAMQKSQLGLLQTLLYDIFRRCPDSIQMACPTRCRWGDAKEEDVELLKTQTWSAAELRQTINNIKNATGLPRKFCFFIDGLDEFDGDHLDLCELLASFSSSSNIKLCVSSRPWNVFENRFGSRPRLDIHTLTQHDVLRFAQGRLEDHPNWESCSVSEIEKNELISEIGTRAEGVFLWVFLVTRSLRDGLTNEDDIDDLRRRLGSLPSDLESLFKHILGSVDSVYHEQMARLLLVALVAVQPLDLDLYGFMDHEDKDEDYALDLQVRVVPTADVLRVGNRTRHRIDARSRGLLEARGGVVEFLHRTVRDFLHTRDMTEYLAGKLRRPFDPNLSIAKSYVSRIKSTSFSGGTIITPGGRVISRMIQRDATGNSGGWLVLLLRDAMGYASRAEKSSLPKVTELLGELERCVDEMVATGQAQFLYSRCDPKLLVREEVLRSELCDYVAGKLADPDYLRVFTYNPLFSVVQPSFFSRSMVVCVDMLHLLLDHGLDPNEADKTLAGSTPWSIFASRALPWAPTQTREDDFHTVLETGVFMKFLSFGADPNACEPWSCTPAFPMFLLSVFSECLKESRTDAFLRTLDKFLECGGGICASLDLTGSVTKKTLDRYERTSIRWWPTVETPFTLVAAFCTGLRQLGELKAPEHLDTAKRRRLLLAVARKVASQADLTPTARAQLESAVAIAFPTERFNVA